MSKRKLNRRQAWRIEKIQEERARRADRKGDAAETALAAGELGPEEHGLIVAHYGTQVEVEGQNRERRRCHMRANLEGLVTGDNVIWCRGDTTGVVVAQGERKSELLRPDPYGKLKPVAANIDQVMVVIAPLPEPHANLIDRYLIAAEAMRVEPVIVINKSDLIRSDAELSSAVHALVSPYADLGYRLLHTSIHEGETKELLQALSARVSVFVGQSGVGKSSLINTLLPDADLRVGELSASTQKGQHTTTTAQLFHLPEGGSLIDSPGIREFGLWHMEEDEITAGFVEFRPFLGHCRFRDCKHEREPGCAIIAAVADGAISERRLLSYRHILTSLSLKD